MFDIKLIKHQDLTESDVREVIDLKSKQWDFNFEKQLQWIKDNIKKSDLHMFLLLDNESVAYLNLIDIDLIVDDIPMKGLGVGNVCAIKKGKGFGFELMKEANKVITQSDKIGLLFCKEPLLKYYSFLNWTELSQAEYKINCGNSKVMIFNTKKNLFLKYDGIIF